MSKWLRALGSMAAYGPHIAVATLWLVLVDLGLMLLGHVRLQRVLDMVGSGTTAKPRHDAATVLERTVRAFAWVSVRYPRSHRCLAQATALQRLLARRGIPADLRIGVRREGGGVAGHAWVEFRGRPLAETWNPHRRFVALRPSSTAS